MIQGIFLFLISYICLVLLCLFVYKAYLLNQKIKCAYVIELENNNPNMLIQTKAKVISKKKNRIGTSFIEGNPVDVILKDEAIDSVTNVYFNKKESKYYASRKSKNDIGFEATIESDRTEYEYKIKKMDIVCAKVSGKEYNEKEIVVFKNPFNNVIFLEDEIDGYEVITEVDLLNKIPENLDDYFLGEKSIQALYESQKKHMFDILKPACISVGIFLSVVYVLNVFI